MNFKSLSGINILTIVFICIILILLYRHKNTENFANCIDNQQCDRYYVNKLTNYCKPGHTYQQYMWDNCPKFCGSKAGLGPCSNLFDGAVDKCKDSAGEPNCRYYKNTRGYSCNDPYMKKNCYLTCHPIDCSKSPPSQLPQPQQPPPQQPPPDNRMKAEQEASARERMPAEPSGCSDLPKKDFDCEKKAYWGGCNNEFLKKYCKKSCNKDVCNNGPRHIVIKTKGGPNVNDLCLDHQGTDKDWTPAHMYYCDSGQVHQNRTWTWDRSIGQLKNSKNLCLDHGPGNNNVHMYKCNPTNINQKWEFDGQKLKIPNTNTCLTLDKYKDYREKAWPKLKECNTVNLADYDEWWSFKDAPPPPSTTGNYVGTQTAFKESSYTPPFTSRGGRRPSSWTGVSRGGIKG